MKKLGLYLFFFSVIFVLNLVVGLKLLGYWRKDLVVKNILREIDEDAARQQRQFNYSGNPFVLGAYQTDVTLADGRVANLKSFFRKYNSPLYDYADKIITVSDKYQFDYRLLPAIAMQESNLCRAIPDGSHNCWGWGIYGTTVTKFDSYDEAIDKVAAGLKKNYIDQGLLTASAIMEKYTPSSNGSWQHGVNTFLRVLE